MLARIADNNTVLLPFRSEARNSRLLGRVGRAVGNALHAVGEARRRRATLNELRPLSDRELADIGLTRGDIPWACASCAAQRKALRVAPPAWPG